MLNTPEQHKTTKRVNITIDINIARIMLSVAGFSDTTTQETDDEIFKKVLSIIECYGATSDILQNNETD